MRENGLQVRPPSSFVRTTDSDRESPYQILRLVGVLAFELAKPVAVPKATSAASLTKTSGNEPDTIIG
jgi:hypothetical protein